MKPIKPHTRSSSHDTKNKEQSAKICKIVNQLLVFPNDQSTLPVSHEIWSAQIPKMAFKQLLNNLDSPYREDGVVEHISTNTNAQTNRVYSWKYKILPTSAAKTPAGQQPSPKNTDEEKHEDKNSGDSI